MENNKKFIRFHHEPIGPNYDYYWFEIKQEPDPGEKYWHPIPRSGCVTYYSYPMDIRDNWYFVSENGDQVRMKMSYKELDKAIDLLKEESKELGVPANFDLLTPNMITKFSILEPSNPINRWWYRQAWYVRWFKEHLDHLQEIYDEKIGYKKAKRWWNKAVQIAKKYNSNDKEGIQYYAENYFEDILEEKHLCCYLDLAEYIVLRENFHV